MTTLLDGNVLVALVVEDHVHHELARSWFSPRKRFATCPITQGTLLRLLVRAGVPAGDATTVLGELTRQRRHEFWPDTLSYEQVATDKVIGHRQVTDAYLAQLTRSHSARLATLDAGLAESHPDVAELIDRV
jgi:uncharacterized protein